MAATPGSPTIIDVLNHGSEERWLWLAAMLGFLLTCFIVAPYQWRLRNVPDSRTKRLYWKITWMPLTFAITAAVSCIFINATIFCSCLQHFAEAIALHSLNNLIIERLGGKEEAVVRLSHRGPQAWFRAPPLCCLFFCLPKQAFTTQTLQCVQAMTKQFILVVPALSVVEVVLKLCGYHEGTAGFRVVRGLLFLSALVALYGLFIMYKATYSELKGHNITLKFVAIKLVILIGVIQQYCFSLSTDAFHGDQLYSSSNYAFFMSNAVLAMESPFLTYLVLHGFPISDLEDEVRRNSQEWRSLVGNSSSTEKMNNIPWWRDEEEAAR